MSFTHLRVHSHYSLLKALPKIKPLVKKAKEYGQAGLALTDYSSMYGSIEFFLECKKQGIKPIVGVEFEERIMEKNYSFILIAKDDIGYKNLMHLTSIASMKDGKHLLSLNEIKQYKDGLIYLTGGPTGYLSDLIVSDFSNAIKYTNSLKEIFSDDVYLEISVHTFMDRGEEIRSETIRLSDIVKVPAVLTCNSHYLNISDKPAHKILCLIEGEVDTLDYYNHYFSKGDFSLQSEQELLEKFPQFEREIHNTQLVLDKISLEIPLGKWYFPNIEFNKSYDEDLRELAYKGLQVRRMDLTDEVKKRLDYELEVIKNKGYSPYFLVVYDLLRYARENKILTNIRGSVAGSLVTYLLRITKCDPFEYKLPFERFLNPERPSAPDIDMDYSDTRRDEVIDYARSKYGIDNVAQIGTFGTMMAKGAVRDVARAMKFPYVVGDRISKMFPPPVQGRSFSIKESKEMVPELKEMYETDREATMILDMAEQIEGCARHISVHAAGTVISPAPLWDFTPIQKDPKGGKVITQYDMYVIEDAGLLKYDFLGIRNLTILGDAIAIVKERHGIEIDIDDVPLDDKKTFELLSTGQTMGLFQLNGSGMTKFLKELEPSSIHDINAMVALYRPGPLEMIPEYIARKKDPSLVHYLDPRLKPILDQSFGVITYQDDVMLIAIHLAGYSWLEADKLRKAMGKKIAEEMASQKEKLLKGFVEHGLSEKKANELWVQIEPFASYGFNKAHAASYGRVAYQTAYMKANYPVAYMTAIMTNESGDVEKIAEIVSECKRMKITVLPPNVNYSMGGFSIIKNEEGAENIRFGLFTIKGLGEDIGNAIIAEREKGGKFKSFEDFVNRITHKNLNKKSLEALTKCGALDDFASREDILENLDTILEYHKTTIKDNAHQGSLFGGDSLENTPSFTLVKGKPIDKSEKLKWEKDLLGLFVSGFPLDPWKEILSQRGKDILYLQSDGKDNTTETIGAVIEAVKTTRTKKGDTMALVKLRDYSSVFEVAVFPESYKKYKNMLIVDAPVKVTGKLSTRNGEKTMIVDSINILKIN